MMDRSFTVTAKWDEEAKVWYVADSDVPGLATEAPSVDALLEKLKVMIPEMLELNEH
jgi:predicted RNase H-like HicB family nuclease